MDEDAEYELCIYSNKLYNIFMCVSVRARVCNIYTYYYGIQYKHVCVIYTSRLGTHGYHANNMLAVRVK